MSDQQHLQQVRQALPATTAQVYLNTGTFGPIPRSAIEAMHERIHYEVFEGRLGMQSFERIIATYTAAREAVARLLHCSPDEIALTHNTGEGMNIVSYGLNWQEGDEVITTNHEHISALAPLYQLRDRFGVVIRVADIGPDATRPLAPAIEALITDRTRLISISHVTWSTGTILDIHTIGKLGRAREIPVLIDGAQSAGAIPVDLQQLDVDFYAIPMQKWLCGPEGTGALYIAQKALHYIQPTYVGYWSIKHEEGKTWELNDNAQRFEVGGRSTTAITGQLAALNWLEQEVGYSWLFQRIAALNTYAYQQLQRVPGLTMLTPRPESGLLSFTVAGQDDAEMVKTLCNEHNILLRNIPDNHSLRISTGFYNTEEEIDKLVEVLSHL